MNRTPILPIPFLNQEAALLSDWQVETVRDFQMSTASQFAQNNNFRHLSGYLLQITFFLLFRFLTFYHLRLCIAGLLIYAIESFVVYYVPSAQDYNIHQLSLFRQLMSVKLTKIFVVWLELCGWFLVEKLVLTFFLC